MKKYYYLSHEYDDDTGYNCYRDIIEPKKFEELQSLIYEGMPCAERWNSISPVFTLCKCEPEKEMCDFPPIVTTGFEVVSEKALDCLRPLIEPNAEILPMNVEGYDRKLFGLNITKIYDLDLNRSECEFRGNDWGNVDRASYVYVRAFPDDVLPDAHIFRTKPELCCVFVSEEFFRIVIENNLTGVVPMSFMRYRTGPYKAAWTIGKDILDFSDNDISELTGISQDDPRFEDMKKIYSRRG